MALATRCPACSTVFRISTAQATAKGGTVRCGQCRHVFNSLDALVRVEDLEVIEEVQVVPEATPDVARTAVVVPDAEDVAVDAEPPRGDGEVAAAQAVEPMPSNAASPDRTTDGGGDAASPVEAPDRASDEVPDQRAGGGEWWLPDPNDVAAPEPLVARSASEPSPIDSREDAGRLLSGRDDRALAATGMDSGLGSAYLVDGPPTSRLGRGTRLAIASASLIATIALLGQLAYLWRDEIAVRWPVTRPWLTAACGPLRCTVGYPAHLEWITIESATIQTTGSGLDVYVLNALLRNRASSDVRYPHLELVLTDLEDRPMLRRALRPEDYLPPGGAAREAAARGAQSGFPADSELPIHLTFELGDLRFAGYRVDKFYP